MSQLLDPATVLNFLTIASQLSGYSIPPGPAPDVHMDTTAEFRHVACGWGSSLSCLNDVGLTDFNNGGRIDIDAQWPGEPGGPDVDSVIVHELTHWLQYRHGLGNSCAENQLEEDEAYRAQTQYLVKYEHKRVQLTAPRVCGAPWFDLR